MNKTNCSKAGTFASAVALFLGAIGLLVFSPVITFGCAYIGGMLLKMCVGEAITNGLNLMLNTDRFTPDFIPLSCATLATIGRYFRSTQTTNCK